ncbi:MAG: type II toxin-antitoxin system PemK/MazF family toxin, partial [Chloroflexi bacterium]|nr:type II toxin-antitoxin system PemK/MazF family toxin [Chloroflexota bacterium]
VLSDKIVHDHAADVIVAAISSRPASRPLPTDVQISAGSREHKAAGLKVTSWIKVATLAAIPRTAVSRRLGRLDSDALDEVEKRLRLALGLA